MYGYYRSIGAGKLLAYSSTKTRDEWIGLVEEVEGEWRRRRGSGGAGGGVEEVEREWRRRRGSNRGGDVNEDRELVRE